MQLCFMCVRAVSVLAVGVAVAQSPPVEPAPPIESFLTKCQIPQGITAMEEALKANPGDQQARLSLGIAQTFRGFEQLAQSLYVHGFGNPLRAIPGAGAIIPENTAPKPIRYEDTRAILQGFADQISQAQATLSKMTDAEVKLPLHVGLIRLDINANGSADPGESLWQLHRGTNPFGGQPSRDELQEIKDFVITFDRADGHWLEGYCHFVQGLAEIALAYDERELFDRTAHFLFPKVQSPYDFLQGGAGPYNFGGADISDVVAMVHLLNFQLAEPKRMQAALGHFLAMLGKSRAMWKAVQAETDDDREWIPNINQTSVMPDVQMDQDMLSGWDEFLNEADAILAGKKLVPFWRGDDPTRGVNFNRFFTDPKPFDLVLWLQGSDAKPYLEQGELTSPETWRRLNQLYDGNFVAYAFWFN